MHSLIYKSWRFKFDYSPVEEKGNALPFMGNSNSFFFPLDCHFL